MKDSEQYLFSAQKSLEDGTGLARLNARLLKEYLSYVDYSAPLVFADNEYYCMALCMMAAIAEDQGR